MTEETPEQMLENSWWREVTRHCCTLTSEHDHPKETKAFLEKHRLYPPSERDLTALCDPFDYDKYHEIDQWDDSWINCPRFLLPLDHTTVHRVLLPEYWRWQYVIVTQPYGNYEAAKKYLPGIAAGFGVEASVLPPRESFHCPGHAIPVIYSVPAWVPSETAYRRGNFTDYAAKKELQWPRDFEAVLQAWVDEQTDIMLAPFGSPNQLGTFLTHTAFGGREFLTPAALQRRLPYGDVALHGASNVWLPEQATTFFVVRLLVRKFREKRHNVRRASGLHASELKEALS